MFYSQSTGGFYDVSIHGSRRMTIIEPGWVRPLIEAPDPAWVASDHPDGTPVPMVQLPDMSVPEPTIEIDNPGSMIPDDAVEITADEHTALLVGNSLGKRIVAIAGKPMLSDPIPPTAAEIWERIKTERDRRTEHGGYQVDTKWFHSDQRSRSQQLGLVLLGANIPAGLQWKTMDGAFVGMTSALSQQILGAAAASDQAIFAVAETHKAAMEASRDPASYDFSTGWPLTFGE